MIRNVRGWAARLATRLKVWRRPISDEELDRALTGLGKAVTAIVDAQPQADPEYRDRFIDWLRARDALRAAEQQPASRPATARERVPDPLSRVTRLEVVTTRWGHAIASAGYLPEDHVDELSKFLQELTLHVVAPEQAHTPADRVGYELAQRIRTTEEAFGRTLELLTEFFLSLARQQPRAADWVPVLARFGQGYAAGTRARALEGQDQVAEALHRAKEAELHATLINTRFREILHTAPVAMGVMDPDGIVTTANGALRRLVGEDVEILGRNLTSLVDHDDDPRVQWLSHPPVHDDHGAATQEFRLVTPPRGTPVWVRVHWGRPVTDEDMPGEIPFVLEDVTQHRAQRRWLDHSQRHDGTSDLPSRRQFIERLTASLATAGTERVGVFAVHLDGMDDIRTRFGATVGAQVAQVLVDRTRATADQAEMITQLDGETIGILVAGQAQWAAVGPAVRLLRKVLAAPVVLSGNRTVFVTPLIGSAISDRPHGDADSLIQWLGHCLDANRRAAAPHRPATAVDSAIPDADHHRYVAAAGLGQAIAVDALQLRHTPIGSARSGRVVGSHATLQWTYPSLWQAPIGDVLDVADTLGLAAPAGLWMISRAAELVARWHRMFPARTPFVRIDLPGRQPLTDALVAHLDAVVNHYRFPAKLLQIGVPETSVFDHEVCPWREIFGVGGTGVRLVVNGVGERASRVRQLTGLTLSGVVLDPRLVTDLSPIPGTRQSEGRSAIETLIEVAKARQLETTVPGISTPELRKKVGNLGAKYIQGDLTGQPGTVAELESLVRDAQEIHAVAR
nr:EAL domain-containing protein [Kibdelosporangium sp. MJ126-NF4]CEL15550.1 Sensory box/GGDEF family protein [Kibdelosporangium sp. MJ126-NF4]CTQ98216.1 Sensory box/GGDEF family protein [Kibdelosporangium sp. MJ126-NF4]